MFKWNYYCIKNRTSSRATVEKLESFFSIWLVWFSDKQAFKASTISAINCNYTTNSWYTSNKKIAKQNETKYVNSHPKKKRFLAILHNNLCIFCTVDSLTLSLSFPLFLFLHFPFTLRTQFLSACRFICTIVCSFCISNEQHKHTHTQQKKLRRKWIARALV